MALPTLTQNQTAQTAVAGAGTPTDQQVLDAINTAVAASTYWRVVSSAAGYVEVGPKAGSATPNFRALFTINPTAGYLAPDTTANAVWVGINPSGGTYSNYQSATPYGGGVRFSGYWKCCATGVAENVYLVENDEYLIVVFLDDSTANIYAAIIGAIFHPINTTSAEADGRIYGMFVSGTTAISDTFWSSLTTFMGHAITNGAAHNGVFKPNTPATFLTTTRFQETFDTGTPSSEDGKRVNLPVYYNQVAGADFMIGRLRQMYISQDYSLRDVVVDGAAATVGFALADGISPTSADALFIANT